MPVPPPWPMLACVPSRQAVLQAVLLAGLAFYGLLGLGACGRPPPPQPASPEQRKAYAALPGLRQSPHRQLQDELARLVAERSTPLLLTERMGGAADPRLSARPRFASAEGEADLAQAAPVELARQLNALFPAFSRRLLREQIAAVYPEGGFRFGPAELARARELRAQAETQRKQCRDLVAAAQTGFGLSPAEGPLADLGWIDALRMGCRLEGLLAAECLADGAPEQALPPLAAMLLAARRLAGEWHGTSRLAAGQVRSEALEVLAAIAAHPAATRSTQSQLAQLLANHLADWPEDERAWIGERAAGLVAYELVRDGYFLSLLSEEEVADLQGREILQVTALTARRQADDDQAFYLRTMRRIIAACERPYFARREEVADIARELERLGQTPQQPLVASRLLLADFEQAQRLIAEDQARCEAWLLALQSAVGLSPEPRLNPLTGEPYALALEAGAVVARPLAAASIRVPVRER